MRLESRRVSQPGKMLWTSDVTSDHPPSEHLASAGVET